MSRIWKIGEKFKVLNDKHGKNRACGYEGRIAEVIDDICQSSLTIKFLDNGQEVRTWHDEQDMELIMANKVSNMLKRMLDKDSQTLYKAGYINGNLELTEKGQKALSAVLFDSNKAALVSEAQTELDEEKENS